MLSRLARLQQEDVGKGAEEKSEKEEAVEETNPITLEEKAECALSEGRLCTGCHMGRQ